ncbi:MAG: hypothetical protein ACLFPQ_04020 [Candidatus Woesearchaeota archaeon]
MKKTSEYLLNLFRTFNPFSYSHLSESIKANAIKHFLATLFLATLIMSALYVPKIIGSKQSFDEIIGNFSTLKADVILETKSPVNITLPGNLILGSDSIVIDTQGNVLPNQTEVLIDGKNIYYNKGNNVKYFDEFTNIIKNKEAIKKTIYTLITLLFPALVALSYVFYVIAFGLIILLSSLIMSGILKILKLEDNISLNQISNIGLYASTFLSFGIIMKPVVPVLKAYFYVLFAVFFVLGCIMSLGPNRKK